MNWWDVQVARPAAAWIAQGGRGAPFTVEEQLAAKIRSDCETSAAKPKRRRNRDGSTASDDFPPASQEEKPHRASKRQREKSEKREPETFLQQDKGGGKDYWNEWLQPVESACKDKYAGLPAVMDKKQRTEIYTTWNRSTENAPE